MTSGSWLSIVVVTFVGLLVVFHGCVHMLSPRNSSDPSDMISSSSLLKSSSASLPGSSSITVELSCCTNPLSSSLVAGCAELRSNLTFFGFSGSVSGIFASNTSYASRYHSAYHIQIDEMNNQPIPPPVRIWTPPSRVPCGPNRV